MKTTRLPSGATLTAQEYNALRSDAAAASFLHAHQQLGALALPTNPTNGQTISLIYNGTTVTLTGKTGSLTTPGDFAIQATPALTTAVIYAGLQNPTTTTATFVGLNTIPTAPNAVLMQYVGYALPSGGTTITIFSLNTSTYAPLTSFSASTTVTGGSWTGQTLQLYVQPGTYYIGTTRVLFLGASTPTFTAPVSNPRIDIVTLDSSGTVAITQGSESATPSAPTYPKNKVVVCEVYNVVGETALYDVDNQQAGQGYISNDVRNIVQPLYISATSQVATGLFILDPGSEAQGDLLYYNGATWVLLAPGTSGFFLQTQGASANPAWAQPSTQLFSTATPVTVSSGTTTEQTMMSFSLTGNVLGSTGVIKGKLQFSGFPINSSGITKTVRLYFGVTAISASLTQASGNSTGQAYVEWEILGAGATNSQILTLRVVAVTSGAVSTTTTFIEIGSGSASIDSTSAQTVKVTTQDSGTTGNIQTMVAAYAFS